MSARHRSGWIVLLGLIWALWPTATGTATVTVRQSATGEEVAGISDEELQGLYQAGVLTSAQVAAVKAARDGRPYAVSALDAAVEAIGAYYAPLGYSVDGNGYENQI